MFPEYAWFHFFSKTWQELCLSIKEVKRFYVQESPEVRLAPPDTHRNTGNTQLLPHLGGYTVEAKSGICMVSSEVAYIWKLGEQRTLGI